MPQSSSAQGPAGWARPVTEHAHLGQKGKNAPAHAHLDRYRPSTDAQVGDPPPGHAGHAQTRPMHARQSFARSYEAFLGNCETLARFRVSADPACHADWTVSTRRGESPATVAELVRIRDRHLRHVAGAALPSVAVKEAPELAVTGNRVHTALRIWDRERTNSSEEFWHRLFRARR